MRISDQFVVCTSSDERVYVHANEHVCDVCMSVCAYVMYCPVGSEICLCAHVCMCVYVCLWRNKCVCMSVCVVHGRVCV